MSTCSRLDLWITLHDSTLVRLWNADGSLAAEAPQSVFSAAPDLLKALDRAHLQIIELLNEGDFKRKVELDLGYIVDAVAKANGKGN